jgi:hypothetical protein
LDIVVDAVGVVDVAVLRLLLMVLHSRLLVLRLLMMLICMIIVDVDCIAVLPLLLRCTLSG